MEHDMIIEPLLSLEPVLKSESVAYSPVVSKSEEAPSNLQRN